MNIADLCPEGTRLKEKYIRHVNAYLKYQRIHMMMGMIHAKREFDQHVVDNECDTCKEVSDDDNN